jgi:hypothetical protein
MDTGKLPVQRRMSIVTTLITTPISQCECRTSRASLVPIPIGGPLTKFYVCKKCSTVWVERYRTAEGKPESVVSFNLEDVQVPQAVREQARVVVGTLSRYLPRASYVRFHSLGRS